MTRRFRAALTLLVVGWVISAQPVSIPLTLGGSISYLGPFDSGLYAGSVSARLGASLPLVPGVGVHATLGYDHMPVVGTGILSVVPIGVGLAGGIDFADLWNARAAMVGGGYGAMLFDSPYARRALFSGGPFVEARAEVGRLVLPGLMVGAQGRWSWHVGVGQTWSAGLFVSYGLRSASALQIHSADGGSIFPTLFASYRERPVTTITLYNSSHFTVREIELAVVGSPYTASPTFLRLDEPIPPGEEIDIPVTLDLTDRLLGVVGDFDLICEAAARYDHGFSSARTSLRFPVHVYDRNSIIWDDDRKACLFVTEKDPAVRQAMGHAIQAAAETDRILVNSRFRHAITALALLDALNVTYVEDPSSPYTRAHTEGTIDFLRFPRETLADGVGDCDDIAVLYCALLESVGVETALVTIPGHILPAVNVGLSTGTARRLFASGDLIVDRDGQAWIPVETTITSDFMSAWQEGARQWRHHLPAGNTGFYQVREGWLDYPPVALRSANADRGATPDANAIAAAVNRSAVAIVATELEPQIALLRDRISQSESRVERFFNQMGVLYAHFGLLDEAAAAFGRAADDQYEPAIVNLANVLLMQRRFHEALDLYRSAYDLLPEEAAVVLGISTASFRLEHYDDARLAYDELERIDPAAAAENAYLAVTTIESLDTSRAAVSTEDVRWLE